MGYDPWMAEVDALIAGGSSRSQSTPTSAGDGDPWMAEVDALIAAESQPTTTLDFYATPEPEPTFSISQEGSDNRPPDYLLSLPLPGEKPRMATSFNVFTDAVGDIVGGAYNKLRVASDRTKAQEFDENADIARRVGHRGLESEYNAKAQRKRAEADKRRPVSADVNEMDRLLDVAERQGNDFLKSIWLGDMNVGLDQLVNRAVEARDQEAVTQAMELKKRAGQLQAELNEKHSSAAGKMAYGMANMSGPMARTTAMAMAGGPAGWVASADYWFRQGKGDVYSQIKEAGGDPEKSQHLAAVAGLLYVAAQEVQIAQGLKFLKGGKVSSSVLGKIISGAKSAAVTFAKEVGEEVVQDEVIAAAVMASLHEQGFDYTLDEVLKNMWEIGKETAKESALPMAGMTLMGSGGKLASGSVNHIVQEAQEKARNAPLIQAAKDGQSIRNTETGEVFTVKSGTKPSDVRGQFRGWARKQGDAKLEVVDPEASLYDDFNPEIIDEVEEIPVEDEEEVTPEMPVEETPPETHENAIPDAPDVEVGEVSTQTKERTPDEAGRVQEGTETADTKYVLETDPVKRQERLENAYSDVVENQRGVTIPDEVLNRYKDINGNPETKLIAAIKDYYNNTLKGQKVDVAVKDGIVEVAFENDGRKKSVGWRMTPEKAATFEYLKPLLENSTYAYSEANRVEKERNAVPQFHYFVNNANIDGVDIPVKIQVRELNLPGGVENRYYTHGLQSQIKGAGSVSPVNGTTHDVDNAGGGHAHTLPGGTDKIPNSEPEVNKKIKNLSEPTEPSTKPAKNSVKEDAPPTPKKPDGKVYTVKDISVEGPSRSGQYRLKAGGRTFVFASGSGNLVEVVDGKPVTIRDDVAVGDSRKMVAAYLNGADLDRAFPKADHGYVSTSFDSEARVGRSGGGEEYSKDRFAEDGGEDYINGGDSRGEGQQEGADKVKTETNEKRARFDALTPVKVSSEEVRGIERGDGFALRVIGWLKGKGVLGKKYTNDDTGWDNVEVNNMSVRNVIQHHAKDGKVALLEAAPELIKDGIYLETNPKNERGLISHIFTAKAEVDGELYAVGIVVHEDRGGRRYYDHSLTTIEALDRTYDQAPMDADGKGQGLPRTTGSESYPVGKEPIFKILKRHLKSNKKIKNLHADEKVNSQTKKYSSRSSEANTDPFAETTNPAPKASDLRPVEMPELVKMVKAIIGRVPLVKKVLRGGAYGISVRDKDKNWTKVILDASLPKDNGQTLKTLAHEIGHVMTKYGGDGTDKAVATKIRNATSQFKRFIGDDVDADAANLTKEDFKRIRKEAEDLLRNGEEWIDEVITQETPYTPQEIIDIWNSVDGAAKTPELNEYLARLDSAQKKAVIVAAMRGNVPAGVPTKTESVATGRKIPAPRAAEQGVVDIWSTPEAHDKLEEMILEEAEKRRLTEIKTVYDELYALSKKWRPFEEGKDKRHDKYRQKGEEVFADAISVYLNDPAMLEREAPNFWRVFHGWEGERNPFTGVYKAVQELYGKGEEAVTAERSTNLRKGFDDAEESKNQEKEERAKEDKKKLSLLSLARSLYRALFDRYSNLDMVVKDVQKSGVVIADKVNPYLNKRSQPYVKSQQSAYLDDVWISMKDILGNTDKKTIADIGEYLTYARISMGDRGEIWNVQGLDARASELGLKHLERKLGSERFNQIKEAAQKFAELREEHIIKEIVDSGAFSKEYIEKVIKNKRYATFDVLRRLGREYGSETVKGITGLDALPVGAHKQTGTTRDIRNPLLATLENDMKMLAFIDRNNFAKNAIDLLMTHKNTLGYEAKKQPKNRSGGYDKYDNTVFVLRDGKREAYMVSKELVSSFKNPKRAHALLRATDKINNIVRDLITQKNPAFWVWNFQRDFRSFHRNVDGSVWRKVAYLAKAYPEIWQYTITGRMSVDVKSALMEKAMLPSSAYSKENMFDQDGEFFRTLDRFDTEAKKAGYCRRSIDKILHGLDTINDTMELATKLAGYKMLKENSNMSVEKRAHTVRTRIGTPDIYAGGEATPWINRIFMFANVNLQGLRESLAAINENKGRAAQMAFMYSAIPAMLTVLAERNLLSDILGRIFGGDDEDNKKWVDPGRRIH
jgi:hypothetical protein